MMRSATIAACATLLLLAGCGSNSQSGSTTTAASTPEYCAQRSELATQIQDIASTDVLAEGTNALKGQVETALTTFGTLATSAKSDFPQESAGLETAVTSLKGSVNDLSDSTTRAAALAALPGQLRTAVDAAKQLGTAIQSKCGT